MTRKLKKGEIWLANLNPNKGVEPGKMRPVLILQDQALLDILHPSTLILPLTTNLVENAYPLRIRISKRNQLKKHSDILIDQLRAIDNRRLAHGPLATITADEIKRLYKAVCEVMGMDSPGIDED